MATIIKHPYTVPIDFRKSAEDDIVTAFYKNNEVKLIYRGDKKVFESKRLYTTFTADNGSLYINNLNSTYGHITDIYIDGVLQKDSEGKNITSMSLDITKPTGIKIKGQFTVQDSTCDMYDFFIADGLEWVVSGYNTMFQRCTGITDLDLTYFDTSNVGKSMQDLFLGCTSLITANISNFDVNKVENINSLFNSCRSLESVDMSNWKNTSRITSATNVFKNCEKLTDIVLPKFSSLITIQRMFYGCKSLRTIDMSGIYLDNSATVAEALSGVPSDCKIYVSSNFPFSESQLGWDGTFKTK